MGSTAIEIEANTVRKFADTASVANGHVKAANRRASANAREGIGEVRVRAVIMKTKVQAVARRAASSAAPASGGCSA